MRVIRNDCRDCGLSCIHCSKDYVVYECDSCGDDSTETKIYSDGNWHYCAACMLRNHMNDFVRDMVDEYGEAWVDGTFEEVDTGD